MTSTTTKPRPPEYEIRLQAPGPDGPIRLRQLLKVALRRFGLKCVCVVEVPDDPGGEQQQAIRDAANAKRSEKPPAEDGTFGRSGSKRPATVGSHPTRAAIAAAAHTNASDVNRAQWLRKHGPERFGAMLRGELRPRQAHEQAKSDARRQQRKEAAATGEPLDSRVIVGDFRDHAERVPDGSVDLIFTDPPYSTDVADIEAFSCWIDAAMNDRLRQHNGPPVTQWIAGRRLARAHAREESANTGHGGEGRRRWLTDKLRFGRSGAAAWTAPATARPRSGTAISPIAPCSLTGWVSDRDRQPSLRHAAPSGRIASGVVAAAPSRSSCARKPTVGRTITGSGAIRPGRASDTPEASSQRLNWPFRAWKRKGNNDH